MYTTDDLKTAIRILKERHASLINDMSNCEVTLKSLERELKERE